MNSIAEQRIIFILLLFNTCFIPKGVLLDNVFYAINLPRRTVLNSIIINVLFERKVIKKRGDEQYRSKVEYYYTMVNFTIKQLVVIL